jgi:hypothetical protein
VSALTLTIIQLGFLAVLWLFVLIAVSVMRSDLFGVRVRNKPAAAVAKPIAPPAPKQRRGRSRRGTPGRLVIIEGPAAGTTVALAPEGVTLGRAADNTVALNDDYVSSHHARFFAKDSQWYVDDLGSTNGTHVGSGRISGPVAVSIGTIVRLGKTVLEVRK